MVFGHIPYEPNINPRKTETRRLNIFYINFYKYYVTMILLFQLKELLLHYSYR